MGYTGCCMVCLLDSPYNSALFSNIMTPRCAKLYITFPPQKISREHISDWGTPYVYIHIHVGIMLGLSLLRDVSQISICSCLCRAGFLVKLSETAVHPMYFLN